MTVCPKCRQYIRTERLGIRLPPLKARIVDAIKAAGDSGITSRELVYEVYRDYPKSRSHLGIKAHIFQINEMLVETDWRIVADPRCGIHARWYLWRGHRRREAAE